MWQDYVISVVGLSFGFLLIPQIVSSMKGKHVNPWSSGLTAVGLLILAYCFKSLGLHLAAIANCITAAAWTTLFLLSSLEKSEKDLDTKED